MGRSWAVQGLLSTASAWTPLREHCANGTPMTASETSGPSADLQAFLQTVISFSCFLHICFLKNILQQEVQLSTILTLHVPRPPDGIVETDFISPLKFQAFKIFPFWWNQLSTETKQTTNHSAFSFSLPTPFKTKHSPKTAKLSTKSTMNQAWPVTISVIRCPQHTHLGAKDRSSFQDSFTLLPAC